MSTRFVVEFEDRNGNRLDVRADKNLKTQRWLVYVSYRVLGKKAERGCHREYVRERAAMMELERLEEAAIKNGWQRRVIDCEDNTPPAKMRYDENGRRLFKDVRTGEYEHDESSFTPRVAMIMTTEDRFTEIFAPHR